MQTKQDMASMSAKEKAWQVACDDVKVRNNYILETETLTDCSFIFATDIDDTPTVVKRAHKLILATASPVFEAMFYGPFPVEDKPVEIEDIKPEIFKKLLKFIYTDVIELDSIETAYDVYYGGEKYNLPRLVTECSDYLSKNKNKANIIRILEFAKLFKDQKLQDSCMTFIQNNTSEVLISANYDIISVETLTKIFSLDTLCIDNELELYAALEQYAEKQLLGKEEEDATSNPQLEITSESAVKAANETPPSEPKQSISENKHQRSAADKARILAQVRRTVRPALLEIRFLSLSASTFSEYKSINSLLTDDEILPLLLNMSSPKTSFPMPEGFSTKMRNSSSNRYNSVPSFDDPVSRIPRLFSLIS